MNFNWRFLREWRKWMIFQNWWQSSQWRSKDETQSIGDFTLYEWWKQKITDAIEQCISEIEKLQVLYKHSRKEADWFIWARGTSGRLLGVLDASECLALSPEMSSGNHCEVEIMLFERCEGAEDDETLAELLGWETWILSRGCSHRNQREWTDSLCRSRPCLCEYGWMFTSCNFQFSNALISQVASWYRSDYWPRSGVYWNENRDGSKIILNMVRRLRWFK